MTINRSLSVLAPFALLIIAAAVAGCVDKKAVIPPESPNYLTQSSKPVQTTSAVALTPGATGLDTPALHVSDELARLCGLPSASDQPKQYAPSFDFDSDAIGDQDRVVLSALAHCLSDGALKGRGLALTGRTDPRGEPEYNMSLGESRADSVRRYLHDLGVQAERLRATS
ncbi:MAG: OmpA family protein, partial [Polyangiaceae bacterium]